jgi:hypothetical protein
MAVKQGRGCYYHPETRVNILGDAKSNRTTTRHKSGQLNTWARDSKGRGETHQPYPPSLISGGCVDVGCISRFCVLLSMTSGFDLASESLIFRSVHLLGQHGAVHITNRNPHSTRMQRENVVYLRTPNDREAIYLYVG